MTSKTELEGLIARRSGRKHCVLVGHGTTGIQLALLDIADRAGVGEVILPANCCPSLAQVITYAGFSPVFADVDLPNCTMSVADTARRIGSRTRAVMPVHLFGNSADCEALVQLCRPRGIALIEDAAQSIGGHIGSRPHGSFGDASILSFGGSKIVSAGAGGALLLDDDSAAHRARQRAAGLPDLHSDERHRLKVLSHRNLYHASMDLLRADSAATVHDSFTAPLEHYRELYWHAFPDDEALRTRISTGLAVLDEAARSRVARAERYARALADVPGLRISTGWRESGIVWRCSLLVDDPEATPRVTRSLRDAGIDASNHYWSLAELFTGDRSLKNASAASRQLVNLWVDEKATDDRIDQACDRVRRCLASA